MVNTGVAIQRARSASPQARAVVLLVYDNAVRRRQIQQQLDPHRFDVRPFDRVSAVLPATTGWLTEQQTVMVVSDQLPDGTYADLMNRLDRIGISFPTLIAAWEPSVPKSVHAMRSGAADYLVEPFSSAQLGEALTRIVNRYYHGAKNAV